MVNQPPHALLQGAQQYLPRPDDQAEALAVVCDAQEKGSYALDGLQACQACETASLQGQHMDGRHVDGRYGYLHGKKVPQHVDDRDVDGLDEAVNADGLDEADACALDAAANADGLEVAGDAGTADQGDLALPSRQGGVLAQGGFPSEPEGHSQACEPLRAHL